MYIPGHDLLRPEALLRSGEGHWCNQRGSIARGHMQGAAMSRGPFFRLAILAVWCAVTSAGGSPCDRGRPFIQHNTLVTDQGTRIRGSTFWLYGWMGNKVEFAQSETAWNNFHPNRLNGVRLACAYRPDHSDNLSLDEYEVLLDGLIDRAAEAGIYVLLEYHYYPGSYSMSGATDFWSRFAPRYADRTHVIYELTNEPVSWAPKDYQDSDLRDFEELWRLCDSHAPETPIIILSFANVGYDGATPREVADRLQGIDWSKTLVGFHTYWRESSERMQDLKEGYPVACTEFMDCEWHETKPLDGICQHSVRLEQLGISWWQWEIMETESEMNQTMPRMVQGNKDAGTWWEADDYESCGGPRDTVAPAITAHPGDRTVEEGQSVTFEVTAAGYPLSYQWTRNGADLEGATQSSYQLTEATMEDDGAEFVVTVSNVKGDAVSATAVLTVTPYRGISIPAVSASPVVDGERETLWDGAESFTVSTVVRGARDGNTDLAAAFSAVWDSDAVYLIVDVTDDVAQLDSDQRYMDDGVELFIDATNGKSTSYTATDFQFRVLRGSSTVWEKNERTAGVVCGMDDRPDGYRCEVAIPWSTLGVSPAAGSYIGLDVHVNDDDDGGDRDCKIAWEDADDAAWQDPSVFRTVRLSDETLEPVGVVPGVARPRSAVAVRGDGSVLRLSYPAPCRLTLYDIAGRRRVRRDMEGTGEIRLRGIPGGVYLLRAAGGGLLYERKIAIRR